MAQRKSAGIPDDYPWFEYKAQYFKASGFVEKTIRLPRYEDAHTGRVIDAVTEFSKTEGESASSADAVMVMLRAMVAEGIIAQETSDDVRALSFVKQGELYRLWQESGELSLGESAASDG